MRHLRTLPFALWAAVLLVASCWAATTLGEEPPYRLVRFAITPPGATLQLNGVAVPWFGQTLLLQSGRYTAALSAGSCCEPLTTLIDVIPPPPGGRAEPQQFTFRLPLRPAEVVLVNAPCGAVLSCPELSFSVIGGQLLKLPLPRHRVMSRCELLSPRPGEQRRSLVIVLSAGQLNAVSWPAD